MYIVSISRAGSVFLQLLKVDKYMVPLLSLQVEPLWEVNIYLSASKTEVLLWFGKAFCSVVLEAKVCPKNDIAVIFNMKQ